MAGFRHIVVDGYNVIHADRSLKALLEGGDQEAARAALRELLAPLHDLGGASLTIVYDGSGAEISIVRDSACKTFAEVFTPSHMTADEFIERLCAVAKKSSDIAVVSRDNLLRLTSESFGAVSIAPDALFDMAGMSARRVSDLAHANNSRSEGEWRRSNPFLELDLLAADIASAAEPSPLISKKLKKRLARISGHMGGKRKENMECRQIAGLEKCPRPKGKARGKESCHASGKLAGKSENGRKNGGGFLGRRLFGGKASAKSLAELKDFFSSRSQVNPKNKD